MSRAERRRKAKQAAREARFAEARGAAIAAAGRKQDLRKNFVRAPSPGLRVLVMRWGREFLVSVWQLGVWPWRVMYRVGARIVGVDPDEMVGGGRRKPRSR